MPYSITINEGFYNAKFVFNGNLNTSQMLSILAEHDPSALLLDSVNGHVKAAFALLVGGKLYECKQKEKVNPLVSFTSEFTKHFNSIARLFVGDGCDWDVKISQFQLLPDFSIEEVA